MPSPGQADLSREALLAMVRRLEEMHRAVDALAGALAKARPTAPAPAAIEEAHPALSPAPLEAHLAAWGFTPEKLGENPEARLDPTWDAAPDLAFLDRAPAVPEAVASVPEIRLETVPDLAFLTAPASLEAESEAGAVAPPVAPPSFVEPLRPFEATWPALDFLSGPIAPEAPPEPIPVEAIKERPIADFLAALEKRR